MTARVYPAGTYPHQPRGPLAEALWVVLRYLHALYVTRRTTPTEETR